METKEQGPGPVEFLFGGRKRRDGDTLAVAIHNVVETLLDASAIPEENGNPDSSRCLSVNTSEPLHGVSAGAPARASPAAS